MFLSISEKQWAAAQNKKVNENRKVTRVATAIKELDVKLPWSLVTFKDGSVGFSFGKSIGKNQAQSLISELEHILPDAVFTTEETSKTRVTLVGVL